MQKGPVLKGVRLFLFAVLAAALMGVPDGKAASLEHPGKRLVRENNCAACHQIGRAPASAHAPLVGPSHERIGGRSRPDWILNFLLNPKPLRPALSATMPDFRLSVWEATALTAYLIGLRTTWPDPAVSDQEGDKKEGVIGFQELMEALKKGDVRRGREVYVTFECDKCHGDPSLGSGPPQGSPQDWGPDLREISRKLTREGIVSVLFSPQQVHAESKMSSFFFEQGKAQYAGAVGQIADLVAYIESLRGKGYERGDAQFRDARNRNPSATAKWGKRLAWQFNCAGCHGETGFASRDPARVAVPLGYRNAPHSYTRKMVASWIRRPQTIPMHERMNAMGRMPTFSFSAEEARQIADWLFSIDGPRNRTGSGMIMMEYGK